jgi:hypothetical protein
MRRTEVCHEWVVYRMTLYGGTVAGNVVCERREWDALERVRPGFHTLLHAGVKTEQEAERLARGTAGAAPAVSLKKSPPAPAGPALTAPPK